MAKTKTTTMEFEAEIVEEAPLAPEEIGVPPPSGTKLQDAMKALWTAPAEAPQPQPEFPPLPAVVVPPPDLLPSAERVGEEVKYLKDFGLYDRKAQWFGNMPKEDEPFFLILCVGQGCRKETWTRAQREDVCEECYQAIQFRMDEDIQRHIKLVQQSTYAGQVGWYSD